MATDSLAPFASSTDQRCAHRTKRGSRRRPAGVESHLTPAMTRLIHLHARIRNSPSAHRPKHRPRIPLMTYPERFSVTETFLLFRRLGSSRRRVPESRKNGR